jgi:hypothetical protein
LIVEKALSPAELPHLPQVVALLRQDITHTNLTLPEMLALADLAHRVRLAAVRYGTLPGEGEAIGGVDYWRLDRRLLPVLVDTILLDRMTRADIARLHIQVLSATDSLAGADRVAAWLRRQGFAVAPPTYSGLSLTRTLIDNYTNDKYLADTLQAALGGAADATVDTVLYHTTPLVDMNIYVGRSLHLNPRVRF